MQTTENQKRFSEYHRLADQLIDASEKDVLMETARMRALHVSYYQSKYGKVSMEETTATSFRVTDG